MHKLSITVIYRKFPSCRYNSRLNVCDDIDECSEEGGPDGHDCDLQFEACVNTIGDYICEELDAEPAPEEQCPQGFK